MVSFVCVEELWAIFGMIGTLYQCIFELQWKLKGNLLTIGDTIKLMKGHNLGRIL